MHQVATVYLIAFGVLTVVGGFVGFARAKSMASLVAGGITGALLVVAGLLCTMIGGQLPTVGLFLGLVVSLALGGRFASGFRKQRKWMPAGMMAVLALGGLVVTVGALIG